MTVVLRFEFSVKPFMFVMLGTPNVLDYKCLGPMQISS